MYLSHLRRWLSPMFLFDVAGDGTGGGTPAADPFKDIKSLDQLPAHLKELINGVVSQRVTEARNGGGSATSQADKEELERLRKFEQERVQKDNEAKGNYDLALKSKDESFETERKSFKAREEKILGRLREKSVRSELVNAAASENAYNPKQVADLLERRVRLTDEFEQEVLNEDGKTPAFKAGAPLTPAQLVAQYLDENPHLRKPSGTDGSGARGGKTTDAEGAGDTTDKTPTDVKAAFDAWQAADKKAKDSNSAGDVTKAHQAKRLYERVKRDAEKKK